MDAKKLGKKIKLARIEHDMTQDQLASAIGAMQKSISRYETGIALPSIDMLERIAKALKKPFGYFLDEEFQNMEAVHKFFVIPRTGGLNKAMEPVINEGTEID
jgi:transcriptional regulator with XRE-family HTH domain